MRSRLLAALIDVAAVLTGSFAFPLAVLAAVLATARIRDRTERDPSGPGAPASADGQRGDGQAAAAATVEHHQLAPEASVRSGEPPSVSHRLGRLLSNGVSGAFMGIAIATRNSRGPGFRVVGLSRVSVNSGGPVGISGALVGLYFDNWCTAAVKTTFGARLSRPLAQAGELQLELAARQRESNGDKEGLQRATTELFAKSKSSFLSGCAWQVVGQVGLSALLLLGSREGRTVRDRITGTIVIGAQTAALGSR